MNIDCLYYNAVIRISPYVSRDFHWMGVNNGRIVSLGYGRPPRHIFSKRKINLDRYRVMPGWVDSHVHMVNMGLRVNEVDVSQCRNEKEVIYLLKRACERRQRDRNYNWLMGYGYTDHLSADTLDQISRSIPIMIRRRDEHAIWVNSLLLGMANIFGEDAGNPRGYLVDSAMMTVLRLKPKPTSLEVEKALLVAQKEFTMNGITSVHDMSSERLHIECLSGLFRNLKFHLRVACSLYGEEALDTYTMPKTHLYDGALTIKKKKIFIDGALGSRGAWLSKAYDDDTTWAGERLIEEEALVHLIRRALQKRFQLIFHVLGDRASSWVLDVLEKYFKPDQIKDKRFRFEHLEIFDSKNLDRMKSFGIIASVQPVHALSDSAWVHERIGKERVSMVGKIKSFLMKDIPTCGGSDAPIESWNPLLGIYAAVTRRPLDHRALHRSWLLDQKVAVREAISLYTTEAAYAEFSEHHKGTLDVGKFADFVVLSNDIYNLHPKEFLRVKPVMTVIGGKIVYEV